jgi:hypothetical protein
LNGHFSVPHNQKVRAAATACIALALPRRVSSCVDLPALFLPFRFHFAASVRKPTAPTQLDEDATHGTHVPAKKIAVITADSETIISRASGAGRLAWFGFGFRVAGSVVVKCQKAPGIYGALVTNIGPS